MDKKSKRKNIAFGFAKVLRSLHGFTALSISLSVLAINGSDLSKYI